VELDELHVADAAAGAPGGGDAVAGGGVGVAGVEVNLAGAAGGQQGVARRKGADDAASRAGRAVVAVVERIQADAAWL
jgi:hypothetical protein